MIKRSITAINLLILFALMTASSVVAQPPEVRTDTDLESLLANRANLTINLPDLGYTWSDSNFTGSADTGTLLVNTTKVIYYFLHWGPIEVPEITEDYVRERIPKIWPGEGLKVLSVNDTIVAGHPAYFAEVMPQRDFYRAFFLIWNCPESGRQFITDMNYNVRYHTPRAELEAEFATTYHTLACHPGAKTKELPDHVVRFDSRRFGIRFDHPLHWFVFENPYGVPHPEYRGMRNKDIGSLLAHLQDMTTDIFFKWVTLPEKSADDTQTMGSAIEHYRVAIKCASTMDLVESFKYDDVETVIINGRKVFKLFGDVVRKAPAQPDPDFVSHARTMVVLMDDQQNKRRLHVVILIDEYEVDGIPRKPVRDIFDRWAVTLAEGVSF
ncbi:MAG: hypothetical protein KOO62_11730 [candidate division Zixibacteria bacterium]|nr:hypothetical protein [candidate division Zixibacteria bacterium]